jgi:hypothetical protein
MDRTRLTDPLTLLPAPARLRRRLRRASRPETPHHRHNRDRQPPGQRAPPPCRASAPAGRGGPQGPRRASPVNCSDPPPGSGRNRENHPRKAAAREGGRCRRPEPWQRPGPGCRAGDQCASRRFRPNQALRPAPPAQMPPAPHLRPAESDRYCRDTGTGLHARPFFTGKAC